VFGEAAQPVEVCAGRDVSQVRAVTATELGRGVPRQSLLVQPVTGAVVRRPPCTPNHQSQSSLLAKVHLGFHLTFAGQWQKVKVSWLVGWFRLIGWSLASLFSTNTATIDMVRELGGCDPI